jgi:hypothetical protein
MVKFRRTSLPALALTAVLALGTFTASVPLTGCTPTTTQIQGDANAVSQAVHQIANVLAATNAALADKLNMAATALTNAVANWNIGSLTNDINTAANIIEVTLAAIPVTAPYASLVGIAVAALDILLANLPQKSAVTALAVPREPNPYRGRAQIKHHKFHSTEYDFAQAWNEQAKAVPGFAPIR